MARLLPLVLVVLILPGPVLADWCVPAPPIVARSYYAGPPVYVPPVYVQAYSPPVYVPTAPCLAPTVGFPLATPAPAPASQPPVRRLPGAFANPTVAPSVSEFRPAPRKALSYTPTTSFYRANYFNPSEQPLPNGTVMLTLNNASGKALLVWIDGVRYLLVEGQSITRDVGREFTWQVEGREKVNGKVPAGERGANIVIER